MAKVRYGVFLVGESWRLYRENCGVAGYESRPDAIAAAKAAARDATAKGLDVELYFQDSGGGLRHVDAATITSVA